MQKDAENHSCHKTDIFTNHAAYSYALMFNFPPNISIQVTLCMTSLTTLLVAES